MWTNLRWRWRDLSKKSTVDVAAKFSRQRGHQYDGRSLRSFASEVTRASRAGPPAKKNRSTRRPGDRPRVAGPGRIHDNVNLLAGKLTTRSHIAQVTTRRRARRPVAQDSGTEGRGSGAEGPITPWWTAQGLRFGSDAPSRGSRHRRQLGDTAAVLCRRNLEGPDRQRSTRWTAT